MAIAVARYLQDGRLDSTFGAGGIVRTNFPRGVEKVVEVSVNPQGRIIVIATDGSNLLIASYLADGGPNPAFNQDGKVTLPFPFRPQDATIDSFGQVVADPVASAVPAGPIGPPPVLGARIVGVGETGNPRDSGFTLARYHPFDRLDQTFGPNGGFVFTSFQDDGSARALSVRVDRQHRIAAAGSVRFSDNDNDTHFAVARYLPNGDLDTDFGDRGRVVTRFRQGPSEQVPSEAVAVAFIGGQGRIVVAGHIGDGDTRSFALARYLENGTLDTDFGDAGRVVTRFRQGPSEQVPSEAVALTADGRGRIVAAGVAGQRFALARYLTSGDLDTSFGDGGRATTDIPGFGNNSSANALFVSTSDETITAVGVADSQFAVARFRDDGRPDSSFSRPDGKVRTVIESGEFCPAQAIAADSQHRLIVAGVVEAIVE